MKAKAREEARRQLYANVPAIGPILVNVEDLLTTEIERRLMAEQVIEAADSAIGWLKNIMDTAELRRISPNLTVTITAALEDYDTALAAYRAHGGTA